MSIPTDIIEEVRRRTSLAEIAAETVELKRSGKNLVGRCPFHAEKTPSFFVNDEEGFFHCFGCGKKGSVYNFLMEAKGFSFPEAVKFLAKKAGITVPQNSPGLEEEQSARMQEAKRLRALLAAACEAYQEILERDPLGEPARQYLRARSLRPEITAKFHLGYGPLSWEFVINALEKRLHQRGPQASALFPTRESIMLAALKLGLVKHAKRSSAPAEATDQGGEEENSARCYDVFRGRLIFPILRSDGAPIAVGGRLIADQPESPKYLNSCESPLYLKRRTLFGLPQALPAIRSDRHVYIVEGYIDVLSLAQNGITNVAASCGTAITADHANVLRRLARTVTVVFDGDKAGRRAAAVCFESFLNSGVELTAVMLPDGEDPDTFTLKNGPQTTAAYLRENRVQLVDIFIDHLLQEESGAGNVSPGPAAIGRTANRYIKSLSQISNPVEREFLARRGAEKLGVSEDSLTRLLTGDSAAKGRPRQRTVDHPASRAVPRRNAAAARRTAPPAKKSDALESYCQQLVIAVLCQPELASSITEMPSVIEAPSALDRLPEKIRLFVKDVSLKPLPSVAAAVGAGLGLEEYRTLLSRYDLEETLLDEALRQLKIGGAAPEKVVAAAAHVAERCVLAGEVQSLRIKESKAVDDQGLEQLAQEKLLKKRNLERLRGVPD